MTILWATAATWVGIKPSPRGQTQSPQTRETYTNTSGSPGWGGRLDSQDFQGQRNRKVLMAWVKKSTFLTRVCFIERFVTNCRVKRMYQGVRNV